MVTFELLNGLRYSGCDGIEYDKTQVSVCVCFYIVNTHFLAEVFIFPLHSRLQSLF